MRIPITNLLFILILTLFQLTYTGPPTPLKTIDTSIRKPKDFDYLVDLFKIKAKWNGANFSAFRSFSENFHAFVSVKKKDKLFVPDLDEGFLTWSKNGFTLSGGKLSKRYGTYKLYKSTSVYNPLFSKWILWKKHGMGLSFEKKVQNILFNGAFTLDTRSCSAIHTLFSVTHKRYTGTLLSGIQSCLNTTENDRIIIGSEHTVTFPKVKIHSLIKYEHLTRFRGKCPSTTDSKSIMIFFFESQFTMAPWVSMTALSYFRNNIDRLKNDHCFYHGYVGELLFYKRIGIGQGITCEKTIDKQTLLPKTFFILKLSRGRITLRLTLLPQDPEDKLLFAKGKGKIY